MKVLKKLSVFMIALLTITAMTSCSSDDDEQMPGAAKVVAGGMQVVSGHQH